MVEVAVIVPARDRGDVLGRALKSVASQRTAASEVIVVDDGSTDDTAAVAQRYGATVLHNDVAQGSGPARNQGIAVAKSEWIAFLDSDDEWYEDHLATVLEYTGEYDLVAAATVDNFGRRRGWLGPSPQQISLDMLFFPENVVSTSGTLIRRQLFEDAGGFKPLDRAQDLDLWMRALRLGRGVALPQVTSSYFQNQRYSSENLYVRSHHGAATVLHEWAPNDSALRAVPKKVEAREAWDDLRLAMHLGKRRAVLRSLAQLLARPTRLQYVWKVLAYRRSARQ